MSGVIVAAAGPGDLERLVPLFDGYRRFYRQPSEPERIRTFLGERLRHRDSFLFLATVAGEAVGFTQLYPTFSSISLGRALILNDLFVLPAARGRGVGRALLDRAADFGREWGARYLELATEVGNEAAQRLYHDAGWVRDTEFHHYSLRL